MILKKSGKPSWDFAAYLIEQCYSIWDTKNIPKYYPELTEIFFSDGNFSNG